MRKSKNLLALIIICLMLSSCVKDPVGPVHTDPGKTATGAYILCEGVFGYDNSSLTRIDIPSGRADQDYFSLANPGLRIGDTANEIVIIGDTVYVVVSTSKSIEAFHAGTGKWIGRIIFDGAKRFPRNMCVVNDSIAYITDAYDNSVCKINYRTFKILNNGIKVGVQPEGIDLCNGYLFVANSGWGDVNKNGDKAGWLSIIDTKNENVIKSVYCGANLVEVLSFAKKGLVYACYYNLPSLKDSLGGIIELDASNLTEKRRWNLKASDMVLTPTGDTLIFVNDNFAKSNGRNQSGLSMIDLRSGKISELISNPKQDEIWYGLSYKPDSREIWICNAKNNRTEGEVLVYQLSNPATPIKVFPTGINPNKIRFF